ncbi:MAG: hypothetical protein COY38_03245 [Candidatus Aenigmarchaeota archaeon CG_4_10_14_0_8_um_filter_37_24]|nr:NAD(P)/FAD-dependent oxidoreductase [Candidatus Aenigmarchaeota archaeon]OIN87119.1 MAG: hypothetical protein AUJ50_03010 [Candidatus Aenigmarchaeota archaeon CG1_02_38_14]PIV68922.1 MAG: hypothetical protein COS07_02545 [Candidatus Aenigmarchaeota archaeon CG01_land_8_20_14_3_00_37_9]PIW41524.1 MAG: hypothetical protein COW21_01345 [Candidatus Aenigmarchaeota archaeon CG15_BIG_FIL_POST_REV_8_21_14_020_37_27]PIX51068.1 MAG: hypothetical protein COZ52_00690 [Candidatus Aenigmarchaeota archaeo
MKDMYDVVIVGAGPIGCKVGELLGKDHKILILDKKTEIGKPVQCTGFTSDRIFELSGASRKIVLNKITRAGFFSPNGNHVTLKSKRPFYVFDRELFDKEMAKKAEKNDVEIKMKTEFKDFSRESNFLEIKTSKGNFKTKLLVGADGPNSPVAGVSNLKLPDSLIVGIQETVQDFFDSDQAELWFGSTISPDFFGWVVPENDKWARVGIGSSQKSGYYLEKFVKKRFGKVINTRDKVGGVIRYGLIENSVADRVLLVGDAACQIKPISGGGLIYGLTAAKIASNACKKSLESGNYDYKFLKRNYDDKWKEKLRWPIIQGVFSSSILHKFPDWLFNFGALLGKGFGPIFQEFVDEDFGLY